MTNEISGVELVAQVLDEAAQFERDMRRDDRFTDKFKQESIQQKHTEAKETARALAERFIADAAQAVTQAEAQYNAAAVEYFGTIDNQRQAVTHTEATVLGQTAKSFAEIENKALTAIQRRDVAMLNSLKDIALPLAIQKAGQSEFSPMHGDRGAMLTLTNTITEALLEMEPDSLKNARRNLQAAQQAHYNLVDGLASVNHRRAMLSGGPGPLAATVGVFQPDLSNVRIKYNQSKQVFP